MQEGRFPEPFSVDREAPGRYQSESAAGDAIKHPAANDEDPMTTFDKREEGFEKKFAHDEELRFKAMARRNKLLGLWVAEKLGIAGEDAATYAKAVVAADFEEAGDNDVFRKVRADLDAKKISVSDQELRKTMDELLAKAVDQIKAGS